MRILHLIDSAGLYGAEGVVLSLMETQRTLGLAPALLSLGDDKEGPKGIEQEAEERGLGVFRLRVSGAKPLRASLEILRYAREWKAEILHSHGYKGDILIGLLPRRFRRIPALTTIHGWTSAKILGKVGVYQVLGALAMKNLDAVVAVSLRIPEYPVLKALRIRPCVIENGLPRLEFPQGLFERKYPELERKCAGRLKLAAIGRLSPEKGFDLLIHALSILRENGLDPILVIFGEGSERRRLEESIRRLELTGSVFLAGYCEKAYKCLPFFDAFVLPSHSEGLPLTLLEAMQAGVPVVATRVGEIPRVLEQGLFGELASPGDVRGLASAIETVLRDLGSARARASAARERALKDYSAERMAIQYLDLYRSVSPPFRRPSPCRSQSQ